MGRSDPFVFQWWAGQLPQELGRTAFLGQAGPNSFSQQLFSEGQDFYDLMLGNWEINSSWNIPHEMYDTVICTRCPYFASDPGGLIKKCLSITRRGGTVFLDWGLGDHWRFPMFKVGWVRGGEHERVTFGTHVSMLYSCFWDVSLENDLNVVEFRRRLGRFGYTDDQPLGEIIRQEVPAILGLSSCGPARVNTLFLWPEAPQLYIGTAFIKDPA